MNNFKYIFEATSRIDTLKRFSNYNKYNAYNLKRHQSASYNEAISIINRVLNGCTSFSAADIKEACKLFAMAEQCNSLYDMLHAKFGQLMCYYVLGNTLDVEIIANNIISTPLPCRQNIKGYFAKIGKGLIVGTGIAISFFPPTKMVGVAMAQYGKNLPTEELKVSDPEITKFISDIKEVDFKKLLNNRPNLK